MYYILGDRAKITEGRKCQQADKIARMKQTSAFPLVLREERTRVNNAGDLYQILRNVSSLDESQSMLSRVERRRQRRS